MERRFSYDQEGQHSGKRKSSYKRRKSDPIINKEKLELETITTIGKGIQYVIIAKCKLLFQF